MHFSEIPSFPMIRSFFAMAWATLAVSVVALFKEIVIAHTFGAGWKLDALPSKTIECSWIFIGWRKRDAGGVEAKI